MLQPCPESGEFREQQCAAYNDVPYEGEVLIWTAHQDDSEPCALTCRGRPAGEPPTQEEPIVVQLAPKVQDGTRCRPGSLDMCIDGKCQVSAVFCFVLCAYAILSLALTFIVRHSTPNVPASRSYVLLKCPGRNGCAGAMVLGGVAPCSVEYITFRENCL